jgi:hypothetical protein
MFVEVAGAVGKLAWEERGGIIELVNKLAIRLRDGSSDIVAFGTGGVGKTTLGLLLSGTLDPEQTSLDYTESENTDKKKLKSKLYGSILVAAGQERRRSATWPELLRGLAAGRFVGVINVVSWGCHSIEKLASYKEHKVYKAWSAQNPGRELSVADFTAMYLDQKRAEEIEALEYIRPHVESTKGKVWMLTVVAEQDLWWSQRTLVRDHYTLGKYNDIIEAIVGQKGKERFYHHYVSASFKWQNLSTAKEILISTNAGYDEAIQRANLLKLSTSVRQLVENAANG